MSSLDIAPYPEGAPAFGRDRCRIRRRLRVSFRRAGSCTFWRLGFRQFSFHRIARVPGAPSLIPGPGRQFPVMLFFP